MAKNQNTLEKRRREMEKKLRAEEKRKNRKQRKDEPGDTSVKSPEPPHSGSTADE